MSSNNLGYLKDSNFLRRLDLENLKKYFVKIIILSMDERPIKSIEGRVTTGSISIDGSSAMRRTCNLTFLAEPGERNDLTNVGNLLSINKKIKIQVGIENLIDDNYDDIVWFNQGIFVITQPTIIHSTQGVSITLSGKDKMCLLNGECGGGLPASVIFDSYDQINKDGSVTQIKNRIYDIIQTLVMNYGGEDINKIFINNVPIENKQIVRWLGSSPLYYNSETNRYTLNSDLLAENTGHWKAFDYNEDIGYSFVEFTYPGELVSGIGDNICSILDKIKEVLGNFEYFYDTEGNFIFQEIKNYLNNSYQASSFYLKEKEKREEKENQLLEEKYDDEEIGEKEVEVENLDKAGESDSKKNLNKRIAINNNLYLIDSDNYYADFNSESKSIYYFNEGNGLITSYSNTPSYSNIKNDFHIWGKNNDGYAIHYHLVIKEKPGIYGTRKVFFYTNDKGDFTGRLRLAVEEDTDLKALDMNYLPADWRAELYLRGLEKIKNGQRPDMYEQELLDFFDTIYDFKKKQFKVNIINRPNDLKYFMDYLEPTDQTKHCSVDSIGQKIYAYQQDKINKIYEMDIPNVVLININASEEEQRIIREKCVEKGCSFSNVDENIYSKIAFNTTGYAAHTTARELLYQYTDYNSAITLQSVPIYYLEANRRITVQDRVSDIYGDYIIKTISLPLDAKSTMSITAVKAYERV